MNLDEIIRASIRSSLSKSGTLLFISGFLIFMGITTCEIFYNGYSTRNNYISELATTSSASDHILELPALVFNSTMIISGIMIIIATFFVQKVFRKPVASVPLGLIGIGLTGVGIFPGNIEPWHIIFALIIFIAGGLAAILSGKIVHSPLRLIFIIFGSITIIFLVFHKFLSREMGGGGAERWLFYPVVFWITGMGAYLLGIKDGHKNTLQVK